MRSLNEYIITESGANYKDDFEKVFNEIKDLNTNYKIQNRCLIYRASLKEFPSAAVKKLGGFLNPDTGKTPKMEVDIYSWLVIYIITTDKGNFYGLDKYLVKDNPKLSSIFKNRVKGATDFAWSKNYEEVKNVLLNSTPPGLNKLRDGATYALASNLDLIKQYANTIKKYADSKVNVVYYKSKIDKIKSDIEYCKQSIQNYTDKLKDLEDELVELQTLQNVGPGKFNENLYQD